LDSLSPYLVVHSRTVSRPSPRNSYPAM